MVLSLGCSFFIDTNILRQASNFVKVKNCLATQYVGDAMAAQALRPLAAGERDIYLSEGLQPENPEGKKPEGEKQKHGHGKQKPLDLGPIDEEFPLAGVAKGGELVGYDMRTGSTLVKMDIGDGLMAVVPVYSGGGQLMLPETEERARHEQAGYVATGYGQSLAAVRIIKEEIERIQKAGESYVSAAMDSRALVESGAEIAKRHQMGALEQVRRVTGYDELRQRIKQQIQEHISFEQGFAMFRVAVKQAYNVDVNTMQELNAVLPDITSHEVAMCSMLQHVPARMLISPGYLRILRLVKGRKVDVNAGVPMLYRVDLDGINFAVGAVDEFRSRQLEILLSRDEYEYLGMTGASSDLEFVPFRPEFARAFRALVLLNIDDSDLYKRVWANAGGYGSEVIAQNLMVGHAKLRRVVLRQLDTFDPNDETVKAITAEIRHLGITEEDLRMPFGELVELKKISNKTLEGLDYLIAARLADKHIYDLTTRALLTDTARINDLFTLMGILEDVPAVLIGKEPFSGYVSGFGKGVKIIDASGRAVGYCPFGAYVQIDAEREIFETLRDIKAGNAVATAMFSAVEDEVEKQCLETDVARSRIEAVADELLLRYRIVIQTRVKRLIFMKGDEKVSYSALKIGADEGEMIVGVLDKIGRENRPLLQNVRTVRKVAGDAYDLAAICEGMQRLADYNRNDKSITIYHHPDRPYLTMTAVERQLLADSVAHEVAHSIWELLPGGVKERYKAISWGRPLKKREVPRHFMTRYSRMQASAEEDFAEHFAMYANHGPEFRGRAAAWTPMREKYNIFKEIFTVGDAAGRTVSVEYSDEALVSVTAMERSVKSVVARINREEAEGIMRARSEAAFKHVQARLQRRVKSTEEIIEEEQIDEDEGKTQKGEDVYDEDYDDEDTENGYYPEDDDKITPISDEVEVVREALIRIGVDMEILENADEDTLVKLDDWYRLYKEEGDEGHLDRLDKLLSREFECEYAAEDFVEAMDQITERDQEEKTKSEKDKRSDAEYIAKRFSEVSQVNILKIKIDATNPRLFDVDIGSMHNPDEEANIADWFRDYGRTLQQSGIYALSVKVRHVSEAGFMKLFGAIDNSNSEDATCLYNGGRLLLSGGICAVRIDTEIVVARASELDAMSRKAASQLEASI